MTIPQRPQHRNHGKTATTHVKSTAGLWRVHDGNKALPDGSSETVIDPATGKSLSALTYDDARRMKDYAVTKLKIRTAGVTQDEQATAEMQGTEYVPPSAPAPKPAPKAPPVQRTASKIPMIAKPRPVDNSRPVPAPKFQGEGNPSTGGETGLELDMPELPDILPSQPPPKPIIMKSADTPNPDPQLEEYRQAAIRAARPAALEAQQRADKIKAERDRLRALGIDPDQPAKPPKDPNHPKSQIVGLDPVDAVPSEDTNADGGEDLEDVKATGAAAQRDDAARARAQAQADEIAAEGKGLLLFQKETGHPRSSWPLLTAEDRADYRWRAINESDVRVGDIVVYYSEPTEQDIQEAEEALGEPVDLKIMMNISQVVRVIDRDTINLQLDADRKTKTASGQTMLNVKRLPEGADPAPGSWLPATAARGFDGSLVNLLAESA